MYATLRDFAQFHDLSLNTMRKISLCMASPHPPQNNGEPDKISRIFCDLVNFPEMNWGISVYGGTKLNNHEEGGLLLLIILFKD